MRRRTSASARCLRVVGSCGTAGTGSGVAWVAERAERIAKEENLAFTLARIYSELRPDDLIAALHAGKLRPLPPSGRIDADTIRQAERPVPCPVR
jgi:hypothetical protein